MGSTDFGLQVGNELQKGNNFFGLCYQWLKLALEFNVLM
jgi:hypothetical protein